MRAVIASMPRPEREIMGCIKLVAKATIGLLLPLVLVLSMAGETLALAPGTVAPSPQRLELLKRMVADPGNVDLALAYVTLAGAEGDAEGAISTLERLLMFSPHLARLNFQLGLLYHQLGSTDAATAYFEAAAAAPDTTPAITVQIARLLGRPEPAATGASGYEKPQGMIMLGMRYQTNANGGAGTASVDLNGINFLLSDAAMADPDSNAFAAASYHVSAPVSPEGDRLDVDASAYGSLYGKHDELNTTAAEIQIGPNFDLKRLSLPGARLGVYALGGAVGLKGVPYLYTAGLGTVLTAAIDSQTQARVRLEGRDNFFVDSTDRPGVSDMSGWRVRLTGDVRRQVSPGVLVYGALYAERVAAVAGSYADWEWGGSAGTVISIKSPIAALPAKWSLDLSAGALQRLFDAPDFGESSDRRVDREAFAQAALTVPVADGWSAVTTLGYRRSFSKFDLHSYDNASVSLAVTKGF